MPEATNKIRSLEPPADAARDCIDEAKADSERLANAEMLLNPSVNCGITLGSLGEEQGEHLIEIIQKLREDFKKSQAGDHSNNLELLESHIRTLDATFHWAVRKACTTGVVADMELLMRVAMRAQGQAMKSALAMAAIREHSTKEVPARQKAASAKPVAERSIQLAS